MKIRQLISMACALLVALPMLANAEIYKWKDKNGVMRYSDTPPPSNVKIESVGGKKLATSTGKEALAPVTETAKMAAPVDTTTKNAGNKGSKEEAAAKDRQKNAEADKKAKEEKEKIAQVKAENCKTAKTNLANYQQGGRLFKIDDKGERHYMDDKEMKEGATKAQQDISENCE